MPGTLSQRRVIRLTPFQLLLYAGRHFILFLIDSLLQALLQLCRTIRFYGKVFERDCGRIVRTLVFRYFYGVGSDAGNV